MIIVWALFGCLIGLLFYETIELIGSKKCREGRELNFPVIIEWSSHLKLRRVPKIYLDEFVDPCKKMNGFCSQSIIVSSAGLIALQLGHDNTETTSDNGPVRALLAHELEHIALGPQIHHEFIWIISWAIIFVVGSSYGFLFSLASFTVFVLLLILLPRQFVKQEIDADKLSAELIGQEEVLRSLQQHRKDLSSIERKTISHKRSLHILGRRIS